MRYFGKPNPNMWKIPLFLFVVFLSALVCIGTMGMFKFSDFVDDVADKIRIND